MYRSGGVGVLEAGVGEVVAGPHHAALADGEARDALAVALRRIAGRALHRQVDGRVAEGPAEVAGLADELDAAAVGIEEPHGLVEGALQDVTRLPNGGDAGRDRSQRALRLDAALELLVQARVAEHDGRLARQRAEELAVGRVEGVATGRVGADGTDRPLLADERRAHLGLIPEARDPVVGARGVLEGGVGEVVAGPRHAGARRSLVPAMPCPMLTVTSSASGRLGPDAQDIPEVGELLGAGADLVDHHVVGVEQALRLVDRPVEHRRRVAQGRDRGGDLAERALGLHPVGELVRGDLGLGVETGVGENDRRLAGEQAEQLAVIFLEGGRLLRVHADRSDRHAVGDQWSGDHGADPEPLRRGIGGGLVGERVVREIVVRPRDAQLTHRAARHALVDAAAVLLRERHEPAVDERVAVTPAQRPVRVGHDHADLAAIALQQPHGGAQGLDQDVGRVADRGQLRGHLGQRPLRVDAARELVGLGLQAVRELLRLAQVTDRAVGADETASPLLADGVDLGRDGLALAAPEHESDLADDRWFGHEARPRLLRLAHRLGRDDGRPCLAHELLGSPSGEVGKAGREDGEVAVGIGLPHQVGRGDHEMAEARLGGRDVLDELRVGNRDGRVVGQALEHLELLVTEAMRLGERDGQGSHHLALRPSQGGGGHPTQAEAVRDRLVELFMWDARVGQVVLGRDNLTAAGGEAVDPLVDGEGEAPQPGAVLRHAVAHHHLGPQRPTTGQHEREVGTIGPDEASRGLDHAVEDVAWLADGRDAGGDLGQGALRVDPACQLFLRGGQPLDEPLVGDRSRGVVGQGSEERDLGLVEVVDL